MSASAVYTSARPVISVRGRVERELGDGLASLVVEESGDGLARLELCVYAFGATGGEVGHLYQDRRLLDFGAELEVAFSGADGVRPVFHGRITGLEGRFSSERQPEMAVLAEDRLQDLRMTRRTRSFEDMRDEDVVRRIARDHGLEAEVAVDGPRHRLLAQVNQSDLAFLRERARRLDAELRLIDRTLHLRERARPPEVSLALAYGRELREATLLADLARQCTALTVSGWDPGAKDATLATAGPEAIAPELEAGDESGPDVLHSAFGTREERLVHALPLTDAEAEGIARAELRRRARAFVSGEVEAMGDPRIRVGARIELEALGPMLSGVYDVVSACHRFDEALGYRTRLRVERPGIGR